MEKIMSKTNDTSKLDHAKLENRVLADDKLDAVTGGLMPQSLVKRGCWCGREETKSAHTTT
jgi:hypothetical protein